MSKITDLTNKRFGRLLVIKRVDNKNGKVAWLCKCDCGNTKIVISEHLKRGAIKSCGCLLKETTKMKNFKHGLTNHPIRVNYRAMKARCLNPKNQYYYLYGGRGIKVCEEWINNLGAFYEWAINNGYKEGLTIGRIDSNKDYCPENCRWETPKQQARNTSRNVIIKFNNEEKCLTDWAIFYNISRATLKRRLDLGWSFEEAINTPIRKQRKAG